MAIPYRVRSKRNVQNGKNEVKYYAVPTSITVVTLDRLVKEISGKSSLSSGDIYSTTILLTESIFSYLEMGSRVRIDGLGTFSLSLTSKGFEEKEMLTARDVWVSKICFTPDVKLKKSLLGTRCFPFEKK